MNKELRIKNKGRDSRRRHGDRSPLRHSPFSILHSPSRLGLIAKRLTLNARVNPRSRVQDCTRRSGFTLLELVIVISVILILAVGVFLILDPVQLAVRSRDAQRVSDFEALMSAIDFTAAEQTVSTDDWEPNEWNTTDGCVGESDQRVFVSVPSDNGESDPTNLPSGWQYARVAEATLYDVDGTGWLPVDLTNGASVASPISHLPADAINTFASGFYLSYVCSRNPNDYEITARMASELYRTGGPKDAQSDDGGDDIFVYETGSDLTLNPKAPVAYWAMNGGSSGVISDNQTVGFEDLNGSNDGIVDNADNLNMEWAPGIEGGGVHLDGSDDFITISDSAELNDPVWTLSVWFNIDALTGFGAQNIIVKNQNGDNFDYWADYNQPERSFRCGFMNAATSIIAEDKSVVAPEGSWNFGVCTYDNSANNLSAYLNGVLMETQNGGVETPTNSSAELHLGRRDEGIGQQDPVDGILDEVRIYNRTLLPQEIAYYYEALKP